eukprot:15330823-Alexandrium_andersonii.AAC.1
MAAAVVATRAQTTTTRSLRAAGASAAPAALRAGAPATSCLPFRPPLESGPLRLCPAELLST